MPVMGVGNVALQPTDSKISRIPTTRSESRQHTYLALPIPIGKVVLTGPTIQPSPPGGITGSKPESHKTVTVGFDVRTGKADAAPNEDPRSQTR